MICQALITGVKRWQADAVTDKDGKVTKKAYDFHVVNFIDSAGGEGGTQSMSLPKVSEELAVLLPQFEACRMKVVPVHIYHNGSYSNFGGFVQSSK